MNDDLLARLDNWSISDDDKAAITALIRQLQAELAITLANKNAAHQLRIENLQRAEKAEADLATARADAAGVFLTPNGDLVGSAIEQKLREAHRRVMRHHGHLPDGVIEADAVREVLLILRDKVFTDAAAVRNAALEEAAGIFLSWVNLGHDFDVTHEIRALKTEKTP